jgi:hypothetical protein
LENRQGVRLFLAHTGTIAGEQGYAFQLGEQHMKKMMIMAAFAVSAIATPVFAAGPINARQLDQERLIDAGERNGKLTRAEANMLNADQRSIRRLENRMRARHGGRLTRNDLRILHARQDQAQRNLRREKNDRQRGRNHLKL